MFAYIWEYRVKQEPQTNFERVYGPDGDWVKLFRKAPGYFRTELHHDLAAPLRYLTIDYWESKQARDTFRKKYEKEFEALDLKCESLTVSEVFVGDFLVPGSGRSSP